LLIGNVLPNGDGETWMIQRTSKVIVAGAMVLGVMSLGGCATKKYVDEQVGTV